MASGHARASRTITRSCSSTTSATAGPTFRPTTADRYSSLDGYADDILEICEELDLKDVIFVGHSVSAAIGIIAAIRQPERFKKLILVGPSPCYVNDGDYVGGFTRASIDELLDFLDSNHLGWSSAMAPAIMGNADRPELGAELANSFCRTDPEVAKQFARVTFLSDTRQDLAKLKVPSLILQCSDDIIAPTCVGRIHAPSVAGQSPDDPRRQRALPAFE